MSSWDDLVAELERGRLAGSAPLHGRVRAGGIEVEVEADDVDRLGIAVRRLRVEGPPPPPERLPEVLSRQARAAEQLDTHPLRDLRSVEVEPRLGGAVLRTAPEKIKGGQFFDLSLEGGGAANLRRMRRDPTTGERAVAPFVTSPESFGEVVDALTGVLNAGDLTDDG